MTEEKESSGALLQDEALLRRVLERERSLVSRIVSHPDSLEALFSRPEALCELMRAPLVRDDYQFEQLLASVGREGASLRAQPNGEEARLLHLLSNAEALGRLFREQPALAADVAANPGFVEQVKVRKPQFYKALLEKAQERFSKDGGLAEEVRAERESLESFTSEGGKKETEADRKQQEAREPGEALLEAARDGRIDDVQALLERGANPNIQDNDGWTALSKAAEAGHTDIVRVLLERGANPNIQDNNWRTALMAVAWNGHTDTARALLERGANPNLPDRDRGTALSKAAGAGHTDIVRALLEYGADPNLPNKRAMTALASAAWNGHADTARALLERGADPNLQDRDGGTALMKAASNSNADAVRALLEGGANPNLQNKNGQTALMKANSRSIKEMLKAAKHKWRHGGPQQERGR